MGANDFTGTGESVAVATETAAQLCTIAAVKQRLGIGDADTEYDALLAKICLGVAGLMEGAEGAGRVLTQQDAAVQYVSVPESRTKRIWLAYYPIVSVSEIKEASYEDWASATALTVLDDFQIVTRQGALVRVGSWLRGDNTVKVTYTGGYVSPVTQAGDGWSLGAGEEVLPADLEEAAIQQAVFTYQRRLVQGTGVVSAQGGAVGGYATIQGLLPQVAEACRKYRRMGT